MFIETSRFASRSFQLCMYVSYNVLKLSTVLEFTVSLGKLFHLLVVLRQNEFILNVFKALGFFNFFELPRVWVSENSNSPFMEMSCILCTILKTFIISIEPSHEIMILSVLRKLIFLAVNWQ